MIGNRTSTVLRLAPRRYSGARLWLAAPTTVTTSPPGRTIWKAASREAPPTVSKITSKPAFPVQTETTSAGEVWERSTQTFAPNSLAAIALSAVRVVATTNAPAALASCTAMLPTPPAPPVTKTRAPGVSVTFSNNARQAVTATKGNAAASLNSMDEGLRAINATSATRYSASAP